MEGLAAARETKLMTEAALRHRDMQVWEEVWGEVWGEVWEEPGLKLEGGGKSRGTKLNVGGGGWGGGRSGHGYGGGCQ